jgi:hypothetical protein
MGLIHDRLALDRAQYALHDMGGAEPDLPPIDAKTALGTYA